MAAKRNLIRRRMSMADAALQKSNHTPTKRELQRQMEKTREAVSETVGEIKETVNQQVAVAKKTVAGVMDYREQFQNEPLVWSLGAVSAGFALGYTMGYAHKETRGRQQSQVVKFANSLVDEFSTVGSNLVMPTLNSRIKELFGFDFSEVLESISQENKTTRKRKTARKALAKSSTKRKASKKRKLSK